jgi:hypothetical protein
MIAGFQAPRFPDLVTGLRVDRPNHPGNQRPESPPRNVQRNPSTSAPRANKLTRKLPALRSAWADAHHKIRANEGSIHYVVRWGYE